LGCVQVRVASTSVVVSSLVWSLTKVCCVEGAVVVVQDEPPLEVVEVEVVLPWRQDPLEGVWTMVQVDKRSLNVEEKVQEVQEGRLHFPAKMTS